MVLLRWCFAPCGGITRFRFKGFSAFAESQPVVPAPLRLSHNGKVAARAVKLYNGGPFLQARLGARHSDAAPPNHTP